MHGLFFRRIINSEIKPSYIMKMPFNDEMYDIGVGQCSLHNTVAIYAIFLGLHMRKKTVRVGLVCAECYRLHGDKVAVTEKTVSIEEFGRQMYFDDPAKDN